MRAWLALVAALAVTACEKKVPAPAAMDPVSQEEAAAVAAAFERAVEPFCNAVTLGPMIDGENIARRVTHTAKVRPADRRAVYAGLRSVFDAAGDTLCQTFTKVTRWELLRIRDSGGRRTPVFRAISGGGVGYYELELGKSKQDHVVRIVDVYIYVAGERLSDTLATVMGIGNVNADLGTELADLEAAKAALAAGNGAEAHRLLDGFPPWLRDTKAVRILDLQAMGPQHADYLPAIEAFARAFPDDPSVELMSIDAHFVRRDLPAALKSIDRLDRRVGGDPYLSLHRANAYLLDPTPDNTRQAEAAMRLVIAGVPDAPEGYWGLVALLVQRADHAGAVATLAALKAKFPQKLDLKGFAIDPAWQTFLASPEYKAWAAGR